VRACLRVFVVQGKSAVCCMLYAVDVLSSLSLNGWVCVWVYRGCACVRCSARRSCSNVPHTYTRVLSWLWTARIAWCCCRRCCTTLLACICHWEVELELGRELVFRVETVGKVDPTNSAVGVDLHSKRFNVIGAVSTTCEIRQVELNLVPAIVKPHRHRADKWLDPRHGLVVGCTEPSTDILVVQHLHFKREVFLHIFDNHNQERQLNPERLLRVCRTCDVRCGNVCGRNVNDKRLNVLVCDTLDVTITNLLVPDLERLAPDRVHDRQEP